MYVCICVCVIIVHIIFFGFFSCLFVLFIMIFFFRIFFSVLPFLWNKFFFYFRMFKKRDKTSFGSFEMFIIIGKEV